MQASNDFQWINKKKEKRHQWMQLSGFHQFDSVDGTFVIVNVIYV
jgi:hypothetical protein